MLSLLPRLRNCLLLLVVVVDVEIVNVLLCFLDSFRSLDGELLGSLGILGITLRTPLFDDLGLLLFLGISGVT